MYLRWIRGEMSLPRHLPCQIVPPTPVARPVPLPVRVPSPPVLCTSCATSVAHCAPKAYQQLQIACGVAECKPAPVVCPKAESFSHPLPAAPPELSDSDDDDADPFDVISRPVTPPATRGRVSCPPAAPRGQRTLQTSSQAPSRSASRAHLRHAMTGHQPVACRSRPGCLAGVRHHGEPTPDPLDSYNQDDNEDAGWVEIVFVSSQGEPNTWREAMPSPDAPQWADRVC